MRVWKALKLAEQAVVSAKKFLESDTPAAETTKIVLALIALAPIACVGAMAPNVFQLLRPYRKKHTGSVRDVGKAIDILDRSNYVERRRLPDGSIEIRISKKGMRQARKLCLETVVLPKGTPWDGKWRLLFYDVPVKYNAARLAFRNTVERIGMYPLQKSLWAYPHSCEAEILFIANFFGIDDCINLAIVETLLDEDKLLKYFQLKKN